MPANRGKDFEARFMTDFKSTVSDAWLFRLKDQMSGFKNASRNPCDFIAFKSPDLFMLELKSIKGNTFPVDFRQYDILKEEHDRKISGISIGVIIWFQDHDRILYIPIEKFISLKESGKKSFNIRHETEGFYEIPSKKLRVFMQSDYSGLPDYCRGLNERN